jgi:hypothetical protein
MGVERIVVWPAMVLVLAVLSVLFLRQCPGVWHA